MTQQAPIKDDGEHPVADVWRPTLRAIVKALVENDYELGRTIPSVTLRSDDIADHMRRYVADYGETLIELPDETWKSSISSWQGKGRWDLLVDLWTRESGRSDMVLDLQVHEAETGYRYVIQLLYVP